MQLSQRQEGEKTIRIKYNGYSEKYTWKGHLYQIAVIFPQFIVWKLQNDDCSFANHFSVAMLF